MTPRYLERLQRQSDAYKQVFGGPSTDPPPSPTHQLPTTTIPFGPPTSPPTKQLPTPPSTANTSFESQPSFHLTTTTTKNLSSPTKQPTALKQPTFTIPRTLTPPPSPTTPSQSPTLDPVLPPNTLILVTGPSSLQGQHVADQLLARGYRVRGAVRSLNAAIRTGRVLQARHGVGRYETVVVRDMSVFGGFEGAVRGCGGVVHCASVSALSSTEEGRNAEGVETGGEDGSEESEDGEMDERREEYCPSADPMKVIAPAIAGCLSLLEAAAAEPSVKRVVVCSSTAAAGMPGLMGRVEITGASWNGDACRRAWMPPPYTADRCWVTFAASKCQSEQAVWRWYRHRKPGFVLNTVLPGMLWGESLIEQNTRSTPSMSFLKHIFDGDAAVTVSTPPQHFVDVQDAALLHVAALISPDIQNRRIFAAAAPYNINMLLKMMRICYPEHDIPGDFPSHGHDWSTYNERCFAEDILRRLGKPRGFTDLKTCIQKSCDGFLVAEKMGRDVGFDV